VPPRRMARRQTSAERRVPARALELGACDELTPGKLRGSTALE
jgi:hypothetical protein